MRCRNKIKIISTTSAKEAEDKYNEWRKSLKTGDGRLGSLWSISEPEVRLENESYLITVKYSSFDLIDGVSKDEYNAAIENYEKQLEKTKRFKEQNNL